MTEIVRCDKCDNGIQPDWGYCAYCGDVLLTADEKADAYCQTPGAMPIPADHPQLDPLAALAEDMAKALAEGINYQQQMGIPPKWGRDVLTEMRAALDRFRAAKKEQA